MSESMVAGAERVDVEVARPGATAGWTSSGIRTSRAGLHRGGEEPGAEHGGQQCGDQADMTDTQHG